MMDVYTQRIKVRSIDVDMHRRMRTSVLFSLIQEAAIAHTEEIGVGRDKTLDRGLLWVITLQSVEIKRMPCYDEEIVLRTWPGEFMHLIFPRYFSVESADGEVLVRASSMWSLIDSSTRKLIFPESYGIRIDGIKTGEEIALPSAAKSIECTQSRDFTVPYSFVDINGHMSNIRYLDLAEDCIEGQTEGLRLSAVKVEYVKEVRLGESFTISWGRDGNRFYFIGAGKEKYFRINLEYTA